MDKYPGLFLAALVLAADTLPFFVSLILTWDTPYLPARSRQKRTLLFCAAAVSLSVQLILYLAVHRYMQGSWKILTTFWRIATLRFPYQAIPYFPVSLVVRLIAALAAGICFRCLLTSRRVNAANLYPSKMRTALLFSLITLIAVTVTGTLYYSLSGYRNIIISEVGSYNTSVPTGESGEITDYIELYNRGYLEFDTAGMCLSDDAAQLDKYPVTATTIPAKGYLIVPLYGSELSLKKEGGETIFLSLEPGYIADQITTIPVEANYAYCRTDERSDCWKMLHATPGTTNTEGTARLEQQPVFSHTSGFYEDAFDLQILTSEDLTVHYTLDGSLPSPDSPVYSQPIRVYNRSAEPNVGPAQQRIVPNWQNYSPKEEPVDKAFVVRAVAVDEAGAVSKPVSAIYFVNLEEYTGNTVISLVADPEDLWGENGIYVTGAEYDQWYLNGESGESPFPNFLLRGKTWERPAHFTYLSEDLSFEQEIGLRVAGGSTRSQALKFFNLYAREEYDGNELFQENFWENVQTKRIKIRDGFANAFCQLLVPDRDFGTQLSQNISLFINGEFWCRSTLTEKYDAQYFASHFGVNPGNLVVMKQGRLEEGRPEDALLIQELYDFLDSHDMSTPEAYAAFGELVDLQSYIDYMCFNIYIDNMDFTETINSIWWRSRENISRPYEDGKWRFVLYDLDAMAWNDASNWGVASKAEKNTFTLPPRFAGDLPINQQPIFAALKNNPLFVRQFVLTFMDMVNTNFRYDSVSSMMDSYLAASGTSLSAKENDFYRTFFKNRPSCIVPHLAAEFGLTGTSETLTLRQNDIAGGTLVLNTAKPDLTNGQWQGQYYTDYPVTLTAIPREGYRFVRWEGSIDSREATIQVTLSKGGAELHAIFEKE